MNHDDLIQNFDFVVALSHFYINSIPALLLVPLFLLGSIEALISIFFV